MGDLLNRNIDRNSSLIFELLFKKIMFSIDGEEYCKVEPPQGGFWELGEWQDTDMLNPWDWGR